jgi:hypothetical protein
MRNAGSGLSRVATDAVERMLAAELRGDKSEVKRQSDLIDGAYLRRFSRMQGVEVRKLVEKVAEELNLSVLDAYSSPGDYLGDVKVELRDGTYVWIEVKSQTKKEKFRDLTQADYVREGTDFIRQYARLDSSFDRMLFGDLRLELGLDHVPKFYTSWSLSDLWIADLALLVDESKKRRAKVKTPSELNSFLERKFLLHICMEGARLVRLDRLDPIVRLRNGEIIHHNLKTSNANVASIQVAVGEPPSQGRTAFTYHLGYLNAPGRHKLHDFSFSSSVGAKVFWA